MTLSNPIRRDGLEIDEAEDGLIVFDPSEDMVHHLNPSAAIIFDLCDGSRDLDAIAALLGEIYELTTPPREDALVGLRGLAERKLISWETHADKTA
jgi:Coenzyme PQQ synthesis protein D (PqqD)